MVAARRALPVLVLWAALAAPLSVLATRVRDWFDMTDELRYERLAISIARTHSLVPRVHGVNIESLSQLYPLLIAPVFASGYVPHDLFLAHPLRQQRRVGLHSIRQVLDGGEDTLELD